MVCPNCHSDNIIEVQGQHFCINCGQAVPAPGSEATGVQANGLPEGVKILSASGIPASTTTAAAVDKKPAAEQGSEPTARSKTVKVSETSDTEPAADSESHPLIVKSRGRIKPVVDGPEVGDESEDAKIAEPKPGEPKPVPGIKAAPASASEPKPEPVPATVAVATSDTAKPKRHKPGRPKSGPLDAPRRSIHTTAPAMPNAPQIGGPKIPAPVPSPAPAPVAPPADAPLPGPRRMSDIAPRKPRPAATRPDAAKSEAPRPRHDKARSAHKPPKRHHVHKVGVPSLHFGAVMKFSLQARARPHHLGLAGLAAVAFAAVAGYGAWLFLTLGPSGLASRLQHPQSYFVTQLAILAALYYLGRSVGQAAITVGVVREADQRPVPLSKQLGIGVNTFGRHLALDCLYAVIQLALLGVVALLVATGGQTWPVNVQLQIGALFVAFLLLLYLLTAMAITHGLAGVATTLTPHKPSTSIRLGWQLFSHRFELLGLRFLAAAIELLLALPLAALAVAFVAAAPAGIHLVVALGVAVVAWLAGALFGTGTAAWWAALYRQLVLTDRPDGAVNLLSGRQPTEANRAPLALLVSLTTLLIVAVLVLPYTNL